MDYIKKKGQTRLHPRESANFFSKITFFYTFQIFKNIYSGHKFDETNLYKVLRSQEAHKLGNELEKHLKTNGTISIYRMLWSCYGKQYLVLGFVQLVVRTFVIMSIPWTLSQVVLYFQPNQDVLTKTDAYFYAYAMIALIMTNGIYLHNYLLYLTEMGIRIRTAFCSVMYRKCLLLSTACLKKVTVGKIVTLLTKDVSAFESIIFYANDVWIGIVQTAIVCYLLYRKMGAATAAGMGFFLLVIPIQVYVGKMASKLRTESATNTDKRLQITQEAISAIRIVKIFTWENIFSKKISDARKKEVRAISQIFIRKTVILLIGMLTSKFAIYLLIMTYVWMGNSLSAELIFFIFSLLQRIRHALNVVIPMGITEAAELSASVKRIETLLNEDNVTSYTNDSPKSRKIYLENLTLEYNGSKILQSVNFNVSSGFIIVTGLVGSGKSSLLKIILRDEIPQDGIVDIAGSLSYASQEPWVFASTFQQNILFGEALDKKRYEIILRICDLDKDLSTFPKGDQTIVGDNGCNLSNGQKARVNLARALYRNRDIYLLDDCLRSLDVNVHDHIFNQCFEFLKDKLCLFVTQNQRYISDKYSVVTIENANLSFKPATRYPELSISEDIFIPEMIRQTESIANQDCGDAKEDDKLLMETCERSLSHQKEGNSKKVQLSTYNSYIYFGGGFPAIVLILIALSTAQFCTSYLEKLISIWVDVEHEIDYYELKNLTGSSHFTKLKDEYSFVTILYSSMTVGMVLSSIVTACAFFSFTKRASIKLHKLMVTKIINAVMVFFDNHTLGDIINKFSKDLAILDEQFPFVVFEFLNRLFAFCGIIILLVNVSVLFLFPVISILVVMYFVRKIYMPTGMVLQRLDVGTRSHIIGYLNATLAGLTTIRACGVQTLMKQEFDCHQDLYTSASYTSRCCARSFGFILDMICCLFTAGITARFVHNDKDTSAGDVGLAITQAAMMTSLVQYGIRQWAEMENKMTSIERVLDCNEIEQEDNSKGKVVNTWPSEGSISFEEVHLRYPNTDKYILENITCSIGSGEKIAIVGRTGAGKSTLIATILRLYDYEGNIKIDDVNTKSVPLHTLRNNITVVPQDSIIFSGTIRDNIDPEEKLTDAQIWEAIEQVGIRHVVPSLDVKTEDSNLSTGHKQLLCLVRAVIEKNKILILDEANADLDMDNELLVDNVIRTVFSTCTVLAVIHKLHSVFNYDKVMVLEGGRTAEFGCPRELSMKTDSIFSKMILNDGVNF